MSRACALSFTTANLGDEVQTLAALQFIKSQDPLLIDRDFLFDPSAHEKYFLIANGWYCNLQPSILLYPNVDPLLISIHVASEKILSRRVVDYYKQHGPVGCRDHHTQKLLDSKGVPNFFSGCLTLTLGNSFQWKALQDNPYVLFSSIDDEIIARIRPFLPKNLAVRRAQQILRRPWNLDTRNKPLNFSMRALNRLFRSPSRKISDLSMSAAHVLGKALRAASPEKIRQERLGFAQNLLRSYSEASLVITSRLHCALPCLSMGVPVIFYGTDKRAGLSTRVGTYTGLFPSYGMDYSIDKINFNPEPQNISPWRVALSEYVDAAVKEESSDFKEKTTRIEKIAGAQKSLFRL